MSLLLFSLIPDSIVTFRIEYTNSISLIYRWIPPKIIAIFPYLNVIIGIWILCIGKPEKKYKRCEEKKVMETKNLEKTKNKKQKKWMGRNKKERNYLFLSIARILVNLLTKTFYFFLENTNKLSVSILIMKYSKTPLIHLQMFVAGFTALTFYYPTLWIFCSFNSDSHGFLLHRLFLKSIDPKIPIRKVLKQFFIFLPLFIHPLVYLASTDHVPSNASFVYTSRFRTPETVDLYVLDRSIITLVNEYNQEYLNADNAVRGGPKNVTSIWRMIKAHARDGGTENQEIDPIAEYENLFIKDGDTVMLKNMGTDLFLGVENSDKKFAVCTLVSESEYWKVFSDTLNVKSRISRIRLQHISTGRFLSSRDQNFYASIEGIHKGRIFLIEDSRMEDFYKKFLPTDQVKEIISSYPDVKNYQLVLELFLNLTTICTNTFSFLYLKPHKNIPHKEFLEINASIHNFSTIVVFLCSFLVVLNYILYKKYEIDFIFKRVMPLLILYFSSLIPKLLFGTTMENFSSCSMYGILIVGILITSF